MAEGNGQSQGSPAGRVPIKEMTDMAQIMRRWEEEHVEPTYDPVPTLARMAEIVEQEMESFLKMDPDPFDERHPSRADPSSALGQVLKVIFKKDVFMDKLVNDYLRENYWSRMGMPDRDDRSLNIAACRLIIDVMPGLEASAVFQSPEADSLIMRLFNWAEKAPEPLQSYATGLLAAAMEIQDTAAVFREQNTRFVPIMLQRLASLQQQVMNERQTQVAYRPFAHLNHEPSPVKRKGTIMSPSGMSSPPLMSPPPVEPQNHQTPVKVNGIVRPKMQDGDVGEKSISECSNSSWADMESFVIANVSIHPLKLATRQILILRYLTPMGEYQEFLSYIFEYNALSIILNYVDIRETKETRLCFEALKYLAALLCHKKVAIEFINMGGLEILLQVPRPSVAATGVSICLYYLAYCADAMEKICLSSKCIVSDLVSYALWLLECSHNSGRCHATMFFGLSFMFRVMLDEFDAQDGLRKLYNVISTLPILSMDDMIRLNEDEEGSYRQLVRHVMVALKRYFEAHLKIKSDYYLRSARDPGEWTVRPEQPPYKAFRSTPEEVQEQVDILQKLMPFHATWTPVDELVRLGGIPLLLQIIALTYEWNYSGRAETVQSALNVLAICAVRPEVQLVLCELLDLPDNSQTVGMNIILGSCEGELVADPEVQKAALQVVINCVCAPIDRAGYLIGRISLKDSSTNSSKKKTVRSSSDLLQKVWESVRDNNGIIVLLMLMMVKTPITDADEMRALACKALAGLARCEKVRQIISKLPVLNNGNMQTLLKDPVLQEKRQEHVQFQKYYLKLIELITGKNHRATSDDISLPNIHRANVVAQTRIQYNKSQLYQLIYQQLMQDGLTEAANALQKEANLSLSSLSAHKVPTPMVVRNRSSTYNSPMTPRSIFNSPSSAGIPAAPPNPTSPIKLNLSRKEIRPAQQGFIASNRSLQKQTSAESSSPIIAGIPIKTPQNVLSVAAPPITLHSIVTEYLTNQHALCKNPMVTCPPFNLFVPHKCPDPKIRQLSPTHMVTRFIRRQSGFRIGTSMDERLIHSRFCPEKTIRMVNSNSEDGFFTCSEFFPNSGIIALGTYHGEVRLHNIHTGMEEAAYHCHESSLCHIQINRRGELMLTSSSWRRPLSGLWSITNLFDLKKALEDQDYAEFSKLHQDHIVGTKGSTATIYDVETGRETIKLSPRLSNTYSKNRATFNPTDDLILTDGVLFDVGSGKEIHKFDKLNSVLSGVFHPNGLEVLSNTEIWDLRTFHLLRTVPALEHQQVLFSPTSSIMYTYSLEQENEEDLAFESSYKTMDTTTYASIATIDVKKEIYHMSCNKYDTQIAIVENQGEQHSMQESSVKIYDVGRSRNKEDELDEDEEEDVSEGTEGSVSEGDDVRGNLMDLLQALERDDDGRNGSGENGDREENDDDEGGEYVPDLNESNEDENEDDDDVEDSDDDDDSDEDEYSSYSYSDVEMGDDE